MKDLVLVLGLLTFVTGCATTTPAEKKEALNVKVADVAFLNGEGKGCTNLGAVQGDSAGAVGGQSAAIDHMRAMAVKKGSNVVVSNLSFSKTMGLFAAADAVKGIALKCPQEAYEKLVSIDQLATF